MEYRKHKERRLRHLLAGPMIHLMIIPLVILDLFITVYHAVCYPLYGIKKVIRKDYIRIDRHKLKYLNFRERIYCAYCGYANGLMAYGVRIAGDTEKYWCAIKHKKYKGFHEPAHHKDFVKYGDEKAFRKRFG
jgi:hypothetical protein